MTGRTAFLFLVLEFVEGEDPGERSKRDAIPQDAAISIARQMAAGEARCHPAPKARLPLPHLPLPLEVFPSAHLLLTS